MKYSVGQEVMSLAREPRYAEGGMAKAFNCNGNVVLVDSKIKTANIGLVRERFNSKLHEEIDARATNMTEWIELVSRIIKVNVEPIERDHKFYTTIDWFLLSEIQQPGTNIKFKPKVNIQDLVKYQIDTIDDYPEGLSIEHDTQVGDFIYILDIHEERPTRHQEFLMEYSMMTRAPYLTCDASPRRLTSYDIKKVMVTGVTVFQSQRDGKIKETLYYIDSRGQNQQVGYNGGSGRFWKTREEAEKVVREAQDQLEKYNKLIAEF